MYGKSSLLDNDTMAFNTVKKKTFKVLIVSAIFVSGLGIFSALSASPDFLVRDNDFVQGNPKALITLIEYSDFTCGFCEKFVHSIFPRLHSTYIETGKIRFVHRDFPRSPVGPALLAAQAARCAGDQQAFWTMHDRLFNSHRAYAPSQLRSYAQEIGLDGTKFSSCLEQDRHVAAIYQDRLEGGQLGIRGTPAFVLFQTDVSKGGKVVLIPGAFPFEVFQEQIDQLLESLEIPHEPSESSRSQDSALKGT